MQGGGLPGLQYEGSDPKLLFWGRSEDGKVCGGEAWKDFSDEECA